MYGNTTQQYCNKFSPQVLPLNPLGYINFDKSMLSNDQIGFPLIDIPSDSSLMPTDDLFSDTAIVGGSFVSSIFSLPGERFTDLLSGKFKEHARKDFVINISQRACTHDLIVAPYLPGID